MTRDAIPADLLERAYAAIDAANAADPVRVDVDGRSVPAAVLYGQRMTQALDRFRPDASDALKIAARGQHIERFTIPRETYPAGKAGYFRWRTELKTIHEVLEDVAVLVFLTHELDAFLLKHRPEPEKVAGILAKTWGKMSEEGHAAALALNLPNEVVDLLHQGLAARANGEDAEPPPA